MPRSTTPSSCARMGQIPVAGIYYQYSGPALPSASSGFRGLTCVPNLNGSGSMLISALEGPGDIYDIPLDGSQPTIELNTSNYLSTQLGTWVSYDIAAYNNMIVYPQSGSTTCPDLLLGLSLSSRRNMQMHTRVIIPPRRFSYGIAMGPTTFQTIVAPPRSRRRHRR